MSTETREFIKVDEIIANAIRPLDGQNVAELTTVITGRLEDGATFAYIDRIAPDKDESETLMTGADGFYTAINEAVTGILTNVDVLNVDNGDTHQQDKFFQLDNVTVPMVNVDAVLGNIAEHFRATAISSIDIAVAVRDNNGNVSTIEQTHESDGTVTSLTDDTDKRYKSVVNFVNKVNN